MTELGETADSPVSGQFADVKDDEGVDMAGKLPEVRISDAPGSPPRSSTQTDPLPHSHASSSRASLSPSAAAASTRSRRATMDGRANRLSGFFSHLLPTRRPERDPPMPRERSVSPPPSPMGPTAATRPVTPPPPLAPPTLHELGLDLELITSNLTSAQYAMAPTSGTFLAPHYLLLCHGQGLDVLPLNAPPAPQPYALVRRVAFKSVIVMEERGVMVAIAGRRDGVRVYALEEVRRAVEWRLDLELKREESARRSRSRAMPASHSAPSALVPKPIAPPPSYSASVEPNLRPLLSRVSTANLAAAAGRNRGGSLSSIVGLAQNSTQKSEWVDLQPSDEEVLVAAGPEASAALDERTSVAVASPPLQIGGASARRATVGAESAATLSSMRSALAHSTSNSQLLPRGPTTAQPDELETGADSVSFADMLRESRLPPPSVAANTTQRRASVVMLQSQTHPVFQPGELDPVGEDPPLSPGDDVRPRRWSFVAPSSASLPEPIAHTNPIDTIPRPNTVSAVPPIPLPAIPPPSPRQGSHRSTRSHPLPNLRPPTPPTSTPPRRRLFPKILSAFGSKKRSKSRDRAASAGVGTSSGAGSSNGHVEAPPDGAVAAPKLEYIKLPGTKGALLIKAVETPKKSFLAILCGESGEKVELFAGTYRTALGLSRTFILPDSPKSLELQLQGDDLVEVFLVFAQNVFGLEPATVRVREVRIGRNERRAIRRRARAVNGASRTVDAAEAPRTETVITTTVTVGQDQPARRSSSIARRRREVQGRVVTSPDVPPVPQPPTDPTTADELATLTNIQSGPYTTFQQLAFAPRFPLAAIADDYVIPPTYLDFCEYRETWEAGLPRVEAVPGQREEEEEEEVVIEELEDDPAHGLQIQSEPEPNAEPFPIPTPAPTPPPQPTVVKWYYLDPKGVVQGPWKPSIMQNWLREGYLPPELPVRRADESEYTLLKDLRASVEDPAEPFRARPPSLMVVPPTPVVVPPTPEDESAGEGRLPVEMEVDALASTSNAPLVESGTVESSAVEPTLAESIIAEPTPAESIIAESTLAESIIASSTPPQLDPPAEPSTPLDPLAPFTPTPALLKPISLLSQPRHFGPPALFYCSRGGHSTTIVDARGRPVLKGRIHWSSNDAMGDTHRIEAFDVGDRAVLVALRQGGIEALDVGEALLEPGDESRTAVPAYRVQLAGGTSRRAPWVWKLGTSVSAVNANANANGSSTGAENGKRRAGGGKRGEPNDDSNPFADSPFAFLSDEGVIFLARQGDSVYLCERNAGKFRLLKLSKAQGV
ncbi:GYF domain protein [Rhizoctonia solani AG-3 Rhs1AP]|uniref:GYF domain protein n=1 Tax=Rhizoctonia solani AG-3 Rhs1AP TaxID=1086054 RepID=X8JND5_9AGAM|nr:GYF domain protein [Rhizoctonia solani AG-3 Rhs1AP]